MGIAWWLCITPLKLRLYGSCMQYHQKWWVPGNPLIKGACIGVCVQFTLKGVAMRLFTTLSKRGAAWHLCASPLKGGCTHLWKRCFMVLHVTRCERLWHMQLHLKGALHWGYTQALLKRMVAWGWMPLLKMSCLWQQRIWVLLDQSHNSQIVCTSHKQSPFLSQGPTEHINKFTFHLVDRWWLECNQQ